MNEAALIIGRKIYNFANLKVEEVHLLDLLLSILVFPYTRFRIKKHFKRKDKNCNSLKCQMKKESRLVENVLDKSNTNNLSYKLTFDFIHNYKLWLLNLYGMLYGLGNFN